MGPKRANTRAGGRANKRVKSNLTHDLGSEDDTAPQKSVTIRSRAKKDNTTGGPKATKNDPKPQYQLRQFPPLTESNEFPWFKDGDVLVILDPRKPHYQYRLHSQIIKRFSAVLGALLIRVEEKIPKKIQSNNRTALEFCLEFNPDSQYEVALETKSLFVLKYPTTSAAPKQNQGSGISISSHDGSMENEPNPLAFEKSILSKQQASADYPNGLDGTDEILDVTISTDTIVQETPAPAKDLGSRMPQNHEHEAVETVAATTYDRTTLALNESNGLPLFNDKGAQNISLSGINYHDSTTLNEYTGDSTAEITVEAPCTPSEIAPDAGISSTSKLLSKPPLVEAGQNFDLAMVEHGQPSPVQSSQNEIRFEPVTKSAIYAPNNEALTTSIPMRRPSTPNVNEEGRIKESTAEPLSNMPCRDTLRGERMYHLIDSQEANSTATTDIKVVQPSSLGAKPETSSPEELNDEDEDDNCQIISVKTRTPPLTASLRVVSPTATAASLTTASSIVQPMVKKQPQIHRPIESLSSLFLIAYHLHPRISTTDIELALIQSENLVKTSKIYKVLSAVTLPIGHRLLQHGHRLFQSIASEPVRWLKLSIELKNEEIFQESMIHIVGMFPDADNFAPTMLFGVPDFVIDLVDRKVKELDREVSRVNELLMSSSIYDSDIRAKACGQDLSSFDVSMLVHIWREWFLKQLGRARDPNQHPKEPNIQSKLGMLYRLISQGEDCYLPIWQVQDFLRPIQVSFRQVDANKFSGFLQWDTVAYDLVLMKTYASKVVQEICTNRSSLSPIEEGFAYLTCTHIERHELPWAKGSLEN